MLPIHWRFCWMRIFSRLALYARFTLFVWIFGHVDSQWQHTNTRLETHQSRLDRQGQAILGMQARLDANFDTAHEAALAGVQYKHFSPTILDFLLPDMVDNAKAWSSAYIANELNHDEYQLREMQPFLRPGDTVLDLGTNIGLTAILVAKMNPAVRVVGIEPVPQNWLAAKHNIKAAGVADQVTILNAALCSATNKPIDILFMEENTGGSVTDPRARQKVVRAHAQGLMMNTSRLLSYSVYCVTLDEIVERFNVTEVPFTKLDCEGCEYDVVPSLSAKTRAMLMRGYVMGEVHYGMFGIKAAPLVVRMTHSLFFSCKNPANQVIVQGTNITSRVRPRMARPGRRPHV